MTREEETVLIIKGTISDMPEAHRKKVMDIYEKLRVMMRDEPFTALAIALIGAEIAAS